MTIRNLDKLLAPKSVALIGASPEPASVGAIVTANLAAGGFAGSIWLVNPHHSTINDAPCYPTIAALPGSAEMLKASQPSCLRIQGPNCLGLILPEIGLNASFSHRMPLKGVRRSRASPRHPAARLRW
jgi:acetyltransferase